MSHEDAKFVRLHALIQHLKAFGVARLRIGFLATLLFCVLGSACFAQSGQTSAHVEQSPSGSPLPGGSPKAQAQKNLHKNKSPGVQMVKPSSEEAEKAARLAEGRKKFFEQSSGFEEQKSDKSDSPLNSSNGFMPSMGFKF